MMCNPTLVNTCFGVPLTAFRDKPTASEVANLFCELSDAEQSEFFVALGQRAAHDGGWSMQWYEVGKHLVECPNGFDGAYVVEEIHSAIEHFRNGTGAFVPGTALDEVGQEPHTAVTQ